ncbi:MerR family transcriptional regulator [Intrasporangium sp.]|uniref:MerR family transcriptional regulator n=1 Tax=Intrasporangium sp. TaxID=1925024 RepID=UPI003221AB7E
MRVKDLADLADTTVRTVRYYHQLGLLPVPGPGTSWRSYGFAHLVRLMRIRWLAESGVPLAEVSHLLGPARTGHEQQALEQDLTAVQASIDARIADLVAQRDRVANLLEQVRAHGRLSPLPDALVRMYATLLDRPLSPELHAAIARERDLLELACYRVPLPADLLRLVDALHEGPLDELCDLMEQVHRIDRAAGPQLSSDQRDRLEDLVARMLDLAYRTDPAAAAGLMELAAALDRPGVRAAVELAYRSATYRHLVTAVVALAGARSRR